MSGKNRALAVAHTLQCFLKHLRNSIFDVPGEILGHVVIKVEDTDGFGDIADVIGVPDRHGGRSWSGVKVCEGKIKINLGLDNNGAIAKSEVKGEGRGGR